MTPGPSAGPGAAAKPGEGPPSAERLIMLTVALGAMLTPLNSTMIAVALPAIMAEFGAGLTSAGWLVTAYLIGMASLQPVAGKIGDRIGRRRLVLAGLLFFGISSLASAVAPGLWVLLAFRVLQAVSGALIFPNATALVRGVVPEARRGATFGMIGAGVALAAALGPPLGGALVEIAGWRAIFYVNLALVLPALCIGWRWLPAGGRSEITSRFDIVGAFMLPAALIGAAGTLTLVARGATSPRPLVGAVMGVSAAAALFAWNEFRHPDPVIQPRLFRRRAFAAANAGIGLGNLAMYTVLLAVPLLMTSGNGASALQAGLALTALSVAMILISPFGGRLADRFGRRAPTTVGLALLTLGTLPMALAGIDVTIPALIGGLLLIGLGLGLATPGLQTTAVESVEPGEAGVASGVYSTSRYLGSISGSAILAGLLGAEHLDVEGLGLVFLVTLAAGLLATLAGLGLKARLDAN